MKKYKRMIIKLSILLFILIIFALLCMIKNNPSFAEFYCTNISSSYIRIASKISSLIPFSIYELTLIFIIGMCIFYVVTIIKKLHKKDYMQSLNRGISFLLFIFISVDIYVGTASISYGRSEVPIPQYEGEVTQELVDNTFNYFLEDYNNIAKKFDRNDDGTIICPYTFEEINELIEKEYKKLDSNYFSEYTPKAKQLLFSDIFSELHFTGIFWAPTGEANLNFNVHAAELAHTMAHEFAHSKGVFRENDANLVAMYVTITSDNEYLRYSSYYHNFSSLLRIYELTNKGKYEENYGKLDFNIRKEYYTIWNYWENHNLLKKLGNWYNDLFLKLNGSENGIGDYQDNSSAENISGDEERPNYVMKEYSPYQKLFFYLYEENNKK